MNQKHIAGGVIGGLVGGAVFGVLMQMMGMMPVIAGMVGSASAAVGWVVHIVISIVTGVLFAIVFGELVSTYWRGAGYGILYGLIWWVAGALIAMPFILGMGVQFANAFDQVRLLSMMGHAIFGTLLGLSFVFYAKKDMAGAPMQEREQQHQH